MQSVALESAGPRNSRVTREFRKRRDKIPPADTLRYVIEEPGFRSGISERDAIRVTCVNVVNFSPPAFAP